ncbi:mandelate racemase/muconate lactonizing enzyme family protein [Devosia sp.]|uniref:mandelate racemase/muconate lactonizing enzyme family protein n=1 Tax=Devosia sp. TaxID=1871048 RepID=UPI003A8CED74
MIPLDTAAAANRRQATITDIKAMRLDDGFCVVRIDTDAGISGYGDCGPNDGDLVRAVIAGQAAGGGRLPHLSLIGKDPLAIRVHHHNMFSAYPQRRPHLQVLSGIDMALWDLAGKLLGVSVASLLGGPFRDEIELYSHCPQGDFTDAGAWADRVAELKSEPFGFTAYKVDIHSCLGLHMQEYVPSLSPGDIRKVRRSYALAREHFGETDIIVHCHNELDTPSAIAVAEAVEEIKPLYYEDPLQPGFAENWVALRRATNLPIMTGENIELVDQALPFLTRQAVDCLQPDIVNSGGITGTLRIAELASAWRIPITLHNVNGILLNMASQQLGAAIHNCPRIECTRGATRLEGAVENPIVIRDGKMQVSSAPGLGVSFDDDWLKGHRFAGEDWWG